MPKYLREALNKAVPYLQNNPNELDIFIDNGSLVTTAVPSISREYRDVLNLVIEDFSGDQNLLMAPIIAWLQAKQSDAINNPELREKLFSFEVDILNSEACDISINLHLTERVIVNSDGSISSVIAVDEPERPEEMWTVKHG